MVEQEKESLLIRGGHASLSLIKPSLPDSPLSTESVVRSRGSGRRTAPRHTPEDLQKHEFTTHLCRYIYRTMIMTSNQRFGLTYECELLTAGVGPEEPEVVLSPQLGGQREPVALLHLRHLHLRLAKDGRLVVLAVDMDIEISLIYGLSSKLSFPYERIANPKTAPR